MLDQEKNQCDVVDSIMQCKVFRAARHIPIGTPVVHEAFRAKKMPDGTHVLHCPMLKKACYELNPKLELVCEPEIKPLVVQIIGEEESVNSEVLPISSPSP